MNTCEFNLNRLGKHFLANSHWHLVCWYVFFRKKNTYGLKPNIRSKIDIWPTKLNETYHQHMCFQILIAMFFRQGTLHLIRNKPSPSGGLGGILDREVPSYRDMMWGPLVISWLVEITPVTMVISTINIHKLCLLVEITPVTSSLFAYKIYHSEIGDMFTNFGHLPIYAMETGPDHGWQRAACCFWSEKKSDVIGTNWGFRPSRASSAFPRDMLAPLCRFSRASWFRMPFARRFCLFISARWAGTVPGLLPRYAKSLGTLSPSSNVSATVVQSHIIPWSNFILVGGIPTPLKKLSLSVGIIIPNLWKVIKFHGSKPPNQTSYQPGHIDPHNIFIFHYNTI